MAENEDEEITGECLYFLELISISGVCLGDTSYWMYTHLTHFTLHDCYKLVLDFTW